MTDAHSVKVAIVTDVYADGIDEERAQILEEFEARLQDASREPVSVVLVASGRGIHEVKDKTCDVLIFDYGAAQFGATEMARWQANDAHKWAEDHPSSVLLLWTSFTKQIYEAEWGAYSNHANVIYRFESPPLEADDDDLFDHVFIAIAKWLGLLESED